jgi:hypothetical protein
LLVKGTHNVFARFATNAVTAVISLDDQGKIKSTRVVPSVVSKVIPFTFTDAQAVLDEVLREQDEYSASKKRNPRRSLLADTLLKWWTFYQNHQFAPMVRVVASAALSSFRSLRCCSWVAGVLARIEDHPRCARRVQSSRDEALPGCGSAGLVSSSRTRSGRGHHQVSVADAQQTGTAASPHHTHRYCRGRFGRAPLRDPVAMLQQYQLLSALDVVPRLTAKQWQVEQACLTALSSGKSLVSRL